MELDSFAKELGLAIYDTELAKEGDNYIYRVYIMKPNAKVSLEDCEKLSRIISPILDLNPPTEHKYFLEVSSPGIERKLTQSRHFILSIGEMLKIKTTEKEEIISTLTKADDEEITLENGTTLNYQNIKSAWTFINW